MVHSRIQPLLLMQINPPTCEFGFVRKIKLGFEGYEKKCVRALVHLSGERKSSTYPFLANLGAHLKDILPNYQN